MSEPIIIFWTCGDLEEARSISRILVEKRLVACVNMIPHVESVFLWEGEIESASEVKVLLKTTRVHYEAVREFIERESSYEVTEVTYVALTGGNEAYMSWLRGAIAREG